MYFQRINLEHKIQNSERKHNTIEKTKLNHDPTFKHHFEIIIRNRKNIEHSKNFHFQLVKVEAN